MTSTYYSRNEAISLICACYNNFGSNLDVESLKSSILEDSLGEMGDSWNVGLFRFLDEAVYLFRLVEHFATAAVGKNKSLRAQMILCHQVGKTLLAVRILGASGLDGPARQNLRALYEMCIALCRCLVDPNFMRDFADQPSFESANEFWHRYMSKQRTEKFLKSYNETAQEKCLLVEEDELGKIIKALGVGAHPNYLGWAFDWKAEFSCPAEMENMFHLDARRSTEMVLSTACFLSLATLKFVSGRIADSSIQLGILGDNPAFMHYRDDLEALRGIGKTAGLMFLMVAKLTNRNKPNFDPEVHF